MPSKVETLNGLTQLKQSGFGQPWPRHGLKLLYWFSTRCVSFDENNEMVSCCDPVEGDFGFHYFENRPERNGVKLLPAVKFPYYVVGNLNSAGADKLPDYVCEDYTGELDDSNTDRIIVSLDDEWFDRVYVTAHIDEADYDINSTYRISKGLLTTISQQQGVEAFLMELGFCSRPETYYRPQNRAAPVQINKGAEPASTRSRGFWENFCTIL
ncbi:uncharacterized protein [Salminus brasiliensis]|uniref:uncharacterized protein n=1 Tax=Salminus brasiliensis TaxID=930266 RepID=UPI003B82EC4A